MEYYEMKIKAVGSEYIFGTFYIQPRHTRFHHIRVYNLYNIIILEQYRFTWPSNVYTFVCLIII